MSLLANSAVIGGDIDVGDTGHSLRFRGGQHLSRTITTTATSTYSFKFKRGKLGVVSPIIGGNIKFNANDTLTAFGLTTTAVFRDPTAWLTIHISNNGLYVNGVLLGAVTTSAITNGRIGYDGTNYLDGYLARFSVVDGTASAYTNFDTFNSTINEWVSKSQAEVKAVVDAGGANSFMLDFDDGTSLTTLGYDKSSKGNNWTLNNFSLTPGVNYDWMLDVPGNSYATLNPLQKGTGANLSDANCVNSTNAVGYGRVNATQYYTSGKYYAELYVTSQTVATMAMCASTGFADTYAGGASGDVGAINATASGDVLSIALDLDNWTVTSRRNDSVIAGPTSIPAGDYTIAVSDLHSTVDYGVGALMTGQAPLHASATYHSAAGGYFRYAPPTGFLALCQANLDAAGTVTVSGTFTGNANADGPYIWMNGVPKTLTINSNAVTFGTHADKLATGFKVRTASTSYNSTGTNTWAATIDSNLQNIFKYNNAEGNP